MPRKTAGNGKQQIWLSFSEDWRKRVPSLYAFVDNERDFVEIRFKAKDDGTVLAVAKGYDGEGAPIVCFASGYGVVAACLGIDAAIQGGNWRPDKPWKPPGK